MRRFALVFGMVMMIAMSVSVGTAGATAGILHISSWYAGGGALSIWAKVGPNIGDIVTGTFGVGAFRSTFNGLNVDSPLYCLDVFHSFAWGDTWDVETIPIPPDPPNPPPYNTGEAAWIYDHYGTDNGFLTNYRAQGVQLALWEVSHDQSWRSDYAGHSWYNYGNFRYTGNLAHQAYSEATNILNDLYANYTQIPDGSATYYQPLPYEENEYYGQGQIGGRLVEDVPEPGVLVLLGTGLLSVTGAAWRRRRKPVDL